MNRYDESDKHGPFFRQVSEKNTNSYQFDYGKETTLDDRMNQVTINQIKYSICR